MRKKTTEDDWIPRKSEVPSTQQRSQFWLTLEKWQFVLFRTACRGRKAPPFEFEKILIRFWLWIKDEDTKWRSKDSCMHQPTKNFGTKKKNTESADVWHIAGLGRRKKGKKNFPFSIPRVFPGTSSKNKDIKLMDARADRERSTSPHLPVALSLWDNSGRVYARTHTPFLSAIHPYVDPHLSSTI